MENPKNEEQKAIERIEGQEIILDFQGEFPKKVRFLNGPKRRKEYLLHKTKRNGFMLN